MTGGLMQLVAYGAQDIFLTGNPQITFWKVVYRRHTNFAMESIEQTFNGTVGPSNRVTATIARTGDLVHKMYLEMDADGTVLESSDLRLAIDNVELEIGGQRIDRQYGRWLKVWGELTTPSGVKAGYDRLVLNDGTDRKQYVPLSFWFCRNPGLALPLIAMQYHEVKVNVEFASYGAGAITNCALWVDYVYLDTDERRRFAQVSHEYLIEQVQHTGADTVSDGTNNIRLNFNHPVKELVWTVDEGSYGSDVTHALLQLNGHDRFRQRESLYFTHVQPYQHHSRVPGADEVPFYVNVYSFALKPEEHQPSGTCNFSRIDNATLQLTTGNSATTARIYAVNYNVLRVMSGMAGLAYSN